jgi:LysR family transcriptional regulator, hypochlorite-specific transcription factor HypT
MRLEWLEDILAVASTGSFSGAAEQRHLTQSAFSRRIRQIEQHLGVELFDRSQKPAQLRATTLAQSSQIEQISASIRQLVVDLRSGDRMTSNRIVIASQHSLTTAFLPSVLNRFLQDDAGVYVRLLSANLDECFGLLLSRQADVAVVYHLPEGPDEIVEDFLEILDIGRDRMIPVAARCFKARFAEPVAELEIPFISYPATVFFGGVMAEKIIPAFGSRIAGFSRAETALTFAALEMAACGIAVAWVPAGVAQVHLQAGRLVDLSEHLPSCELTVRAVRLTGKPGTAEATLWAQLASVAGPVALQGF